MKRYADMTHAELEQTLAQLEEQYNAFKARGLDLNMARGKPSAAQLELSLPMLDTLDSASDLTASDGTDCRNYGVLAGIPEARSFVANMVGARPGQVIVCGASSLNVMYDTIARAWTHGVAGNTPWGKLDTVRWLCPVPGYDRHFRICEHFGIEMIPVEMTPEGPDMDKVRALVEGDASVKGIWCVPKYSNPQGYSYSDATVRAFAQLKPAAADFRIFWDNAYAVHHLHDDAAHQDQILNILDECERAGSPDMAFEFCSTSKITFPGAGIAAFVSSEANVAEACANMGAQTIGFDKLNQLRHVRFLKDAPTLAAHMSKHAALLRPKFEAVLQIFDDELSATGVGSWTRPNGGYFISFTAPEGTAAEIVRLAADAGVKLTGAGATWPHGVDPRDSDIRIAPSFPTLDDLVQAAHVFTVCVRLAAVRKLLA